MEILDIEQKLEAIRIELIHESYHDGWYLMALKSLKDQLILKLNEIKYA